MTDFNIEIIQQPSYSLEITSTNGSSEPNLIEVITSGGNLIEVSNRDKILPSDFPDNYPISYTTGLLPISRVSGLYSGSGIIFSSGLDGSLAINALAQNITLSGTSGISVSQNGNLYTIYTTGTFGLSSSQIQSLLNSGVSINVISGTGNFNSLSISGTPVSISGHSHTASSITDFNSSVSGLLPVKNILGSGYASVASSGGVFTVSVTGLQPSGNYSISGHTHTSSQITDFNTSVNSLVSVKNVSGSGYVNVLATTGNYIVSVSGLQPSGNYSLSGHQHIASDIINFNSSVSGLLPITNIVGTSGASVTSSGTVFTVAVTGSFGLTTSQIQSLLNSGVSISVTGGTGNFNSLSVNSIPVSTSGHSHLSSSIIDFNSSVSGLLPVKNIINSGYVSVSSSSGIFTIGVTGLQPSGNYSLSGHNHIASNITDFNSATSGLLTPYALLNSGNFITLLVTGTPVSLSGHTHTSSQITDFNSSVSSLISVKNVVGSGYVNIISTTGLFTISVTGLQPSGNYSLVGHNHTSSDITNFNSSVSGLLTPYALLNSGNFTTLLVTGIPVSLSGHTHTSSQITDFNTSVNNLISVKDILAGSGIQIGVTSGIYTVTAYGVAASSASSLITRCENRTGSALPKMTVVYINGGQGNRPTIQKSIASNEGGSSKTYGITASQINDNSAGDVVVFGALIDVDTNQFGATEGSTLYLSPSVSGNLTAIKPTAPNHMVAVGKIVRNHVNQGIIEVSIQNGFELEELHNVATTGAISGQFLKYDGSLWRNSGITSSDIGSFNSSVSGLLTPYAQLNDATFNTLNVDTLFTCNTTNFSIDGDGNTSIGNNSQLVDVSVPNLSVVYKLSFASGTASSGLNVFNYLRLNNTDVSLSGHAHLVSDISNFGSGVSGLSPVKEILPGNNVTITSNSGVYTINASGGGGGSSVSISSPGSGRVLTSDGTSSGIIGQSGLTFINNILSVTGMPVSVSGHSHALTIGSGSGTAITYDSSQTLNILGSGSAIVSYNNSNKTIYINSPSPTRGYEVLGSGKSVFTVDGGYVVGNIDVFYNGVKLLNGNDFTATNGSTFALSISGVAGDVVEWNAFSTAPRYQVIMGEVRSDFVSGVNYIGNAVQGSAEASGVWRIKKTSIDSDGSIISNLTATNVKWTDRLTSTYV